MLLKSGAEDCKIKGAVQPLKERMKKIVLAFVTLLLSGAFAGAAGTPQARRLSDERVRAAVDSVMNKLSVREKIAQLMIISFQSGDNKEIQKIENRLVGRESVGGLIIMDDKLEHAVERLNQFHRMARVPLLITIDGEWGASMRYPELLKFPRQMQLGAISSDSLIYDMGHAIGEECRELNIHVNFAPDVDVNNNAGNPVINSRSFGENKEIVARYGAAYMEGMRDAGVYGSAKHFPGHGDTDVDSHKSLPTLPFTAERLDSLELYPFRYLIDRGVDMVMVGHLEVPALDPTGTPASISRAVVTDFLKNKLGYDGIVITDALNMKGVSNRLKKSLIPLEAFKAGVDILLMPEDVEASITEIEKALKRGEISIAELDEKVRKVLALKAESGMFEKGYFPIMNTIGLAKRMVKDSNRELIERLSKASLTVLWNKRLSAPFDQEYALPIGDLKGKKIGYLALGRGGYTPFVETLLRYTDADTVSVERKGLTAGRLREVIGKLEGCNLIIVGFNETDQRPGKNFGIVDSLYNVITEWAGGKDIIALYMGSPYAVERMEGHDNFKAYIVGYTPSEANGRAMAQLLFGGVAASGTLPVGVLDYKQGHSVKYGKKRIEYLTIAPEGRLSLKDGVMAGRYILKGKDTVRYDSPVELDFTAPLLSYIPAIAALIDSGRFEAVSPLKEIIKIKNPAHGTILLSDLLMQRSGLPPAGEGAAGNAIESLAKAKIPQLQYSDANLYYIRQILENYYGEEKLQRYLSGLYDSMGLSSTCYELYNGYKVKVISTPDDIAKFLYMLHSGGTYGGNRYFSQESARLMEMVITYYSTNSNGFSILNSPSGEVKFFYR